MPTSTIITILKQDHAEVTALLEKATASKDAGKRAQLFAQIHEALTAHTAFEEEHLYPVLEAQKKTRDVVLEAIEEHAVVKHLLREIAAADASDDRWKAKVVVLAENVRHHVQEEEESGGLFDDLEDAIEEEELVRLGEEYLASK